MLDIHFIREHKDQIQRAADVKKIALDVGELFRIDERMRATHNVLDGLREERNVNAKLVAQETVPKKREALVLRGKELKQSIAVQEAELQKIDEQYHALLVKVPTIPSADTPIGNDETGNKEVLRWGESTQFDFAPKTHIELGRALDIIDWDAGVKVAGYRGYYLKNEAVLLQMGFLLYALKKAIAAGYTPMLPPTLVREFALFGSGYFKGAHYESDTDEIYKIANDEKLADGTLKKEERFLVGTAEPSLLAYFADEVIPAERLPLRLVGFSQCYRSEIGSYGKDTKGLYRVHEFMKVELVSIAPADVALSEQLHEEMTAFARELHEDLRLPYRQLLICTGDLGVGKYKQYDLEAWIPSRNGYGETGSASNFLDWQARRLNVKYKTPDGSIKYAYMLNATALPSPRILISILENYQEADGSVRVPGILIPFVGCDVIRVR